MTKKYYGNDIDLTADKIKQLTALGYQRAANANGLGKGDIVVGGAGAEGGIADNQLNGATRLWGNDRDQTAAALGGFIDANTPKYTAPIYDPSADIKRLKQAQIDASIAALDKSRSNALSNLADTRAKIEPKYYASRNNASTGSQLGAKNFAEYLAQRGLTNSGAAAQGEMNRQANLQGALGTLQNNENQEYAQNDRDVTAANNAYEADRAAAIAGAEANSLQQLMQAKQAASQMENQNYWNGQNLDLQKQQLSQSASQWQKQFDAQQTQQGIDNAYRQAQSDIANKQWQSTFDRQTAQDKLDEDYRQATLNLQRQQLALSATRASTPKAPSVSEKNYQNKQNAQENTAQAMDYLNRWASGKAIDDNGTNLGRADAQQIQDWINQNAGELTRQGVDANSLLNWAKNRFTWYR